MCSVQAVNCQLKKQLTLIIQIAWGRTKYLQCLGVTYNQHLTFFGKTPPSAHIKEAVKRVMRSLFQQLWTLGNEVMTSHVKGVKEAVTSQTSLSEVSHLTQNVSFCFWENMFLFNIRSKCDQWDCFSSFNHSTPASVPNNCFPPSVSMWRFTFRIPLPVENIILKIFCMWDLICWFLLDWLSIVNVALGCKHKVTEMSCVRIKIRDLEIEVQILAPFSSLHCWPITAWSDCECRIVSSGKLRKLLEAASPILMLEKCWEEDDPSNKQFWRSILPP